MLNITQALSFLKCLDSSPNAVFSGFWMPESGVGVIKGKGSVHLLAEELLPAYESISGKAEHSTSTEHNPTFHVTLNQTNVLGRKRENILAPRVLCLDLDWHLNDQEYSEIRDTFSPTLIVESSPNKYHYYWKISPDISLPEWSDMQLGLAFGFKGDLNLRNISATIRVPGFPRITKAGLAFTPRIKHRGNPRTLTHKELIYLFPLFPTWIEEGKEQLKSLAAEQSRLAKELRKGKPVTELSEGIGRNALLYSALKDFAFSFTWHDDLLPETIEAEAYRINDALPEPLPLSEVADVLKKVQGKREAFCRKKSEAQIGIMEDYVETAQPELPKAKPAEPSRHRSKLNGSTSHTPPVERPAAHIPDSIYQSARLYAQRLFKKDPDTLCKIMAEDFTSKSYEKISHYFCQNLNLIGKFRVNGPSISVKDTNFWGETVHAFQTLGKEVFLSFSSEAVNALSGLLINHDEYSKQFKSAPSTSLLNKIALTIWKVALGYPPVPRQSDNIICFQDGVFDLTTGTFTKDLDAPLLNSHPIACYWNYETEKGYVSGLPLTELVPVFAKYFADWFPRDIQTAKVLFRFFGYCCTTSRSYQTFAFFHGPGGAGKGSLAEVIQGIVGYRNSVSFEYKTLDGGFKLAEMHDRLVIAIDEAEGTEAEHLTRLSLIKKLTGGQRMQIERKYQLPFEDEIVGKCILMANESPTYQDKGGSIQRRILALGFEQSYSGVSVDLPSSHILRADASKIATLSALFWHKALQAREPKPFHVKKSLAIEVGEREVVQNIDIIKKLCDKFLEADPKSNLKSAVLKELVYYVTDREGKNYCGRPESRLKQEISVRYPGAKYSSSFSIGDERSRGYKGLRLNRAAILAEYPDVTSDMGSLVKFQELAAALVLSDETGQMIEMDD